MIITITVPYLTVVDHFIVLSHQSSFAVKLKFNLEKSLKLTELRMFQKLNLNFKINVEFQATFNTRYQVYMEEFTQM